MKLRTQVLGIAACFVVAIVIISASIIITSQQLDRLSQQEELVRTIEVKAHELSYISNEYLQFGDPRQIERWEAKHASIAEDLANLTAGPTNYPMIVSSLAADSQRTREVFYDVVRSIGNTSADTPLLEVSWSRLTIQGQGLVSGASRLSDLLAQEQDRVQRASNLLITALLGTFSAFLLAGYLLVYRRTLTSIAGLSEGATIIGSGNLNHTIQVTGADEVAELSHAFNRMTADLRTVTASRADLEREVADRVEAEEALKRERDFSAAVVSTAGALVVVLDRDGRIVRFNKACERLTGYTSDEVQSKPFWDLFLLPEEIQPVKGAFAELLNGRFPLEFENYWVTRDGDHRLIHWANTALADPSGVAEYVIGTGIDITEQKEAEEKRRESDEQLRTLIENSPDGILITDEEGRITTWNRGMEMITGLAAADVLGVPGWEVQERIVNEEWAGADYRTRYRALWEMLLQDGTYPHLNRLLDVQTRLPTGEIRHLQQRVFATLAPRGFQVGGILRDVTEQKQGEEALRAHAEDLRRSNEDLERYAYVSSHDLQEPLRSIVSFAQLLERRYKGQLDQNADEYIDFIVEGGNRMQTLILDLLAYSRVNSTAQERRPTDVEAVMGAVERHLDLSLREANATFTHDPLPTVTADPLQLEQVFENLVSNAIKFHRDDEPLHVHVGARRLDGFWEFSVKDNGIGIEPEYFDRIFVIFQRLHTKDRYPGTGIGLAIVKRIIDRHGGRIWLESTPGEGSTFFFTLPAA